MRRTLGTLALAVLLSACSVSGGIREEVSLSIDSSVPVGDESIVRTYYKLSQDGETISSGQVFKNLTYSVDNEAVAVVDFDPDLAFGTGAYVVRALSAGNTTVRVTYTKQAVGDDERRTVTLRASQPLEVWAQ